MIRQIVLGILRFLHIVDCRIVENRMIHQRAGKHVELSTSAGSEVIRESDNCNVHLLKTPSTNALQHVLCWHFCPSYFDLYWFCTTTGMKTVVVFTSFVSKTSQFCLSLCSLPPIPFHISLPFSVFLFEYFYLFVLCLFIYCLLDSRTNGILSIIQTYLQRTAVGFLEYKVAQLDDTN